MPMRLILPAALMLLVVASAPVRAQATTGSLTDVTGVWVMLVEGHQIGLELEQKNEEVEGIMHAMGQRILLVGTFAEGKLTLKGERPEDQLPHANSAEAGPITATMLDNGTLEGELWTNRGRTKWTGERLKKPPAKR